MNSVDISAERSDVPQNLESERDRLISQVREYIALRRYSPGGLLSVELNFGEDLLRFLESK